MGFSNDTVSEYINSVCNDIRNCFVREGAFWYDEWFYNDRREYYSLAESVVEHSELKDILKTACEQFAGINILMIPTGPAEIKFFCVISKESTIIEHELIYTLMLTQS